MVNYFEAVPKCGNQKNSGEVEKLQNNLRKFYQFVKNLQTKFKQLEKALQELGKQFKQKCRKLEN